MPLTARTCVMRCGEFELPLRVLATLGEQHDGFQGFAEIPTDYGLLFVNCGEAPFHMKNVGAELLLLAVALDGTIVGAEIRHPEENGRVIRAFRRAQHVIELSPIYRAKAAVGQKVLLG